MLANITLKSPLTHGSFGDFGNANVLRREPVVSLEGMPRVPCISGNSLRGVLRRLLAREMFDACGIGPDMGDGWDKLYAAVANGGTIEKSEKRLQPARIAEYREHLPMVSVFGSWFYKWGMSGHLRLNGFVWPVCKETVEGGLVQGPDNVSLVPAEELVSETNFVRTVDSDVVRPEETGVKPMPHGYECLSTGAQMQVSIGFARHTPDVERSCIAHGLDLITHLGGGGAKGLGFVEISHGGDGQKYVDWLESNKLSVASALADLPNTWGQ